MPNKIAPHEGREIELVLSGKKPFAVIEAAKDPKQFRLAFRHADKLEVRATKIDEISLELRGTGCRHHYKYIRLLADKEKILASYAGKAKWQTAMGRLFGYSDEEIQAFTINPPKCTCGKCGGK